MTRNYWLLRRQSEHHCQKADKVEKEKQDSFLNNVASIVKGGMKDCKDTAKEIPQAKRI